MNVIFVCTGNTCRSPMAEGYLKDRAPNLNVKSAGIFAHDDALANPNTIKVLQENNIALNHQSQKISDELMEWAHIILTMTNGHKTTLIELYPQYSDKIFTLPEYTVASPYVTNIADPFGGNMEIYRKTYEEIAYYIELLLEKFAEVK